MEPKTSSPFDSRGLSSAGRGDSTALADGARAQLESPVSSGASGVRIHLMGGLRVEVAGRRLQDRDWERPTARRLVELLAVTAGHRLHREQVMEALWPDLSPDSAERSLRTALHRARRALDVGSDSGSSCLPQQAGIIVLLCDWIDADAFEAATRGAMETHDAGRLAAALELYGGEVLPEERYSDWSGPRREQIEDLYHQLRLALAEQLESRGDIGGAIEQMRQALARRPADEATHRALMRAYLLAGRGHDAIRQFQLCREALREELGVEPEPETVLLQQELLAGRGRAGPEAATTAVPPPIRQSADLPLIGRQRAIDLLTSLLQRAREGRGGMMLLTGEPGIGKTRLAEELARTAAHDGDIVLWGAAYDAVERLPYGPFVEALESGREREGLTALLSGYPYLLALADPAAGGLTQPSSTSNSAVEQRRVLMEAERILDRLTPEGRALVVVIDDLHSADAATIALLRHLAQRAADRGWLILGTYRDEEAPPGSDLHGLTQSLVRRKLCSRIFLLRLARDEAASMVEALLGDRAAVASEVVDVLYELTLGNPLFLRELVSSLVGRNRLRVAGDTWEIAEDHEIEPPREVSDLVTAKLHAMNPASVRLIHLASAAGMQFTFGDLREASDATDEELLDALDEALAQKFVEERGTGYAFGHPLIRAGVYRTLSPERRRRLHDQIAEATERLRPQDAGTLAYHFSRSHAPERARPYLELAGDRAAQVHAADVAASHYRELMVLAEEYGTPADVARSRVKLARQLQSRGRYEEAIELLDAAIAWYRQVDERAALAEAATLLGFAYQRHGRSAEGEAAVEPIRQLLEDDDPIAELAALLVSLSVLRMGQGKYEEGLKIADRARVLAQRFGLDAVAGDAEMRQGTALFLLGRLKEGAVALERAVVKLEASDNRTSLLSGVYNLANINFLMGKPKESLSQFRHALKIGEEIGDPNLISLALAALGNLLTFLGRCDEARTHLERGVGVARELAGVLHASQPLRILAQLEISQGRFDRAAELLAEGQRMTAEASTEQSRQLMEGAMAMLDSALDRHESTITRLAPIWRVDGRVPDTFTALSLAEAYLGMGDEESRGQAEEVVRETEAGAEGNRIETAYVLRVKGDLRVAQNRMQEAELCFHEALKEARTLSFAWLEALTLLDYGRALTGTGRLAEGVIHLEAAACRFHELGAEHLERKAREALAAA